MIAWESRSLKSLNRSVSDTPAHGGTNNGTKSVEGNGLRLEGKLEERNH